MGDDVEGVVVGDERTNVQTRHILDTVFLGDALCQFLVGTHLVAQSLDLLQKLRMRIPEIPATFLVASVEYGTIGEDDSCRHHHAVAVGMDTTIHARCVVDDDATHHRRADGGWVWWEHTAIGLQKLIHLRPHNARLEPDRLLILANLVLLPVLARHDEHRVGTTLS